MWADCAVEEQRQRESAVESERPTQLSFSVSLSLSLSFFLSFFHILSLSLFSSLFFCRSVCGYYAVPNEHKEGQASV